MAEFRGQGMHIGGVGMSGWGDLGDRGSEGGLTGMVD